MDPFSHRLANALVGNSGETATLEVTLSGPALEFESNCVIAIAGAEFVVTVDGEVVPHAQAIAVASRSKVEFATRLRGARAYLAVDGGFDVPLTLGSRATHLISGMGGLGGRALRANDRLPLGDPDGVPGSAGQRAPIVPLPDRHARLRVLPGPQVEYFALDALDVLQSAPYVIGQNSDRMGFRLDGPRLTHFRGADIISDATPLGVLQVPASGQPILLMADRQTAGGYPKLATVITADMAIAGQLGPGDTIHFTICTPRDALAALIAQERALMAVEGHYS